MPYEDQRRSTDASGNAGRSQRLRLIATLVAVVITIGSTAPARAQDGGWMFNTGPNAPPAAENVAASQRSGTTTNPDAMTAELATEARPTPGSVANPSPGSTRGAFAPPRSRPPASDRGNLNQKAASAVPDAARTLPPDEQPIDPPYGYPRAQDPLFDDGTRLPYARQHLEKGRWNRPSYQSNLPQYVKPSFGQDPVRKPTYRMPLAVQPLDNKPRYEKPTYFPPSVVKPSYEFPTYMERPNYVFEPLVKPPVNRPAYDRSQIHYDRPEYLPPTYVPQEYKPPRYAPSPYIASPR